MLAAACEYALDHHAARLAEDHMRAARLADGLRGIDKVVVDNQHTNMVFVDVPRERLAALKARLDTRRVRASIGYLPRVRLVTHLDIDDVRIERAVEAFRTFHR